MPAAQRDLFTKRMRRPPPAPEFNLHCMVADVLRRWGTAGWRWTHLPMGEYRPPATAARLKRMGTAKGWSDFILLSPVGVPHFLELKRRGGKLSDEQEDFANWCFAHSVAFVCADQFDDAISALKRWKALRMGMFLEEVTNGPP